MRELYPRRIGLDDGDAEFLHECEEGVDLLLGQSAGLAGGAEGLAGRAKDAVRETADTVKRSAESRSPGAKGTGPDLQGQVKDAAQTVADDVGDRLSDGRRAARQGVDEHPLAALLIVGAAGYLAAILVHGRR